MDLKRGDMMASRLRQSHDVDPVRHNREIVKSELFFRRNYLRHLPADKAASILEIGCGLGHFMEFCKTNGYTDVTGLDLSEYNVTFCCNRGFRAELCEGGAYLEQTDRRYAVIVMNDVIEHIPKDHILPLLELIRSRLLAGGAFIMKTLNAANPILGAHGRYADFTHETSWTEESMREVLEQTGYVRVAVYPSNLYVFYRNPLNWVAWSVASCFELFFLAYFRLHGRTSAHIFTKNIIGVGRSE